jgi:hypothetical protein
MHSPLSPRQTVLSPRQLAGYDTEALTHSPSHSAPTANNTQVSNNAHSGDLASQAEALELEMQMLKLQHQLAQIRQQQQSQQSPQHNPANSG